MTHHTDMPPDEFRRAGARTIDWIADYIDDPTDLPVLAAVEPGQIRDALPGAPPHHGESIDRILEDFQRVILPGITHWNHPAFFAYFGITGSAPGILGELLSAALNVNAMLWQTSPAATELEQVAVDWLRQILGLPEGLEGVIMDTASVSTLCALAAARHALADLDIRGQGMAGRPELPRLRLYASDQAHSSVEKAAIVLGLGTAGVVKIASDSDYRMDVGALERAVAADTAAGHRPFCVVATVGTTSTTSIDPVPAIADVCESHGLWLHVDAAYAGSAAAIPEYRRVLAGCEHAQSLVINPHKWLFTPIDCSVLYTSTPGTLTGAFSLVPEYLRTRSEGDVRNFMDWGVSLGRRFRALKLWMILRYFGTEGLASRLREHIRLAQTFARWIDDSPGFERLAPTPLSVVCFRARPQRVIAGKAPSEVDAALNAFNSELLQRVNASGAVFMSHTELRGRYTIRLAIGNLRTTMSHVERAWELLQTESERLERDWVITD